MPHHRPVLFLKANPHHDKRGRFTHAPGGRNAAKPNDDAPPIPLPETIGVTHLADSIISGESPAAMRTAARAYARRHFSDAHGRPIRIINAHTGWSIGLGIRGVKHALGKVAWPDQVNVVAGLPSLLAKAALVQSRPDYKRRTNVVAAHELVAPMVMGGNLYAVRMVAREHPDGTMYYHHDLTRIEDIGNVLGASAKAGADGTVHKTADAPSATMRMEHLLGAIKHSKELLKALPPGARWITVHPNGSDGKGHPVLIQPASDGAYRVIGGAGGKLNYLKLTGVRSEAEYKAEAAKKAHTRREIAKDQRAKDKADGILEAKGRARDAVKDQLQKHQADFVKTVADALGWKPEEMRFPEEKFQNASEAAAKKARDQHARALFQAAQEAVDTQRQALVADAEARSAAGLSEVPLITSKPEDLTVEDLAPVGSESGGLGFDADYAGRAEAKGLTQEDLASEAAAARPPPKPGADAAKAERKSKAAAIAGELERIRETGPRVDTRQTVDPKKAVELLKAKKALDLARKAGRERMKEIDTAKTPEVLEPKAFVLEVGKKGVDDAAVKDLENDLRTLRTRAFLEEVGRQPGGVESLGKHIGVGAFNSANALALAAGGNALLDRSVVDVLGPAGAAQVLARRLSSDLTPDEFDHVREAMGRFHVEHYMKVSQEALHQAREWQELAQKIELGEGATGADLAEAQEMNATRRKLVTDSQRVLGQALGEMETNAALVVALEAPRKDQLQVSMGKTDIESAIRQARAIGLERGDYTVEKVGNTTMLTVTGAGQDRLAQPIARSDLERVRTALDIIEGRKDEDGWLPGGVANRPDMAMTIAPGVAPRIAAPFPRSPPDVATAVNDYIGGRMADGDSPASIMRDLLSEDVIQRAGDRGAFMDAVNRIAPIYDSEGKMIRAEAHAATFETLADGYVQKLGGDRLPLHRQNVALDDKSVDALHRALMEHPEGVAAFKPIGDLTPQDQAALRETFAQEHGRTDPEAEKLRAELATHTAAEPEKETEGLFGSAQNPAWAEWRDKRDEMAERANNASMNWAKYVGVMGSPQRAYAAMQDVVRSNVLRKFADEHNRLRPDAPLKIGRTAISHDLDHLDALDPTARDRRLGEHRALVDRLRNRAGGRYAAGSVADKIDAAREADAAADQAQMGLFGATEEPPAGEKAAPEEPLALGQRWSIGHAAERTVTGMMPHVGAMFRGNQPVKIWQAAMSGKFVGRQRAVKLIAHNKRVNLAMGTGSGKTSIMMAAFTHQKEAGQAKRGLFLVPSIVQGQFHGEALTLLQPGKYRWHADPNASREQRLAAYRDPKTDFSVVTHQAFRDDMLHLAAERDGTTPQAIADQLDGMKPAERSEFMKGVMEHAGMDHDYLAVDEGHNLLNREGKENSRLANVVDAVSSNMSHYVSATADPVKNDTSEAWDALAKMDPARYNDRAAFMRRYGVDTAAAKEGLKREMARHFYTAAIDPGVKASRQTIAVQPDEGQTRELDRIEGAVTAARMARMKGGVDLDALRRLSPGSFADVPEARHAEVGDALNRSLGIVAATARKHAINGGAKTEKLAELALARKGKPGVVFAHNLDRVKEIAARLEKDGHRVVTLTGSDSTGEKDKKKAAFQGGKHDIIVMSDAGAVGANLQRGKWLVQYDIPDTAMTHAQRGARIHRIGQTADVELMDLVADHPVERRARDRLAKKYDLRAVMTSPLDGLDDTGIAGMLSKVRSGQAEAAMPTFMPSDPADAAGLAPADEQHSLF